VPASSAAAGPASVSGKHQPAWAARAAGAAAVGVTTVVPPWRSVHAMSAPEPWYPPGFLGLRTPLMTGRLESLVQHDDAGGRGGGGRQRCGSGHGVYAGLGAA
jgi:hypothetical protein